MATRTISDVGIGARAGGRLGRRGFAIIASTLAVVAGLAVAIVVAATFALNPAAPERVVEAPALGPMDDYYFRHGPAPIQLGPQDDYGLRHGGD